MLDGSKTQSQNKAVIDNRLCSWCATDDEHWLVFIDEQNLVRIDAVVSAVTLSSLKYKHTIGPTMFGSTICHFSQDILTP